jgi:TRAP-type C4-dicarboxylate transport system permease small subunit
MWLLVVYILNVLVGESVVIAIGLGLDRTFPYASLPVSLSLFFFVFWLSWVFAVRWTEPKHAKSAKLARAD